MQNSHCVVMTACINPANGPFRVERHRIEVRLEDYRKALNFWLHLDEPRITAIVFVDNSAYPLDELEASARESNPFDRRVEFISVAPNEKSRDFTYGHAELAMLDEAVRRSQLLLSCGHFVKATGRLQFAGISRLLDELPSDYVFAVDCRLSGLFSKQQNLYASTQLMFFSVDFYRTHVLDSALRLFIPPLYHIENVIFACVVRSLGLQGAVFRWPVSIQKIGFSGNPQRDYASLKERLKELIRGWLRRIAPGLWI